MDSERKKFCRIELLLTFAILGSTLYVVHSTDTNAKEGSCPVIPGGTVGTCVDLCFNDSNCEGVKKCCTNGCGHACSDPVPDLICPPIKTTSAGICMDECSDKKPCTNNRICCPNGCGHVCVEGEPIEANGLSHVKAGDREKQDSGGRSNYPSPLVMLLFGFVVTATISAD